MFKQMKKKDDGVLLEHYVHLIFAVTIKNDLIAYVGLGVAGQIQLNTFCNRVNKWCETVAATGDLHVKTRLLAGQSLLRD